MASWPQDQPRKAKRRPNLLPTKPNKMVLLWRNPASATFSASRRFFGDDDARAASFFLDNADAIFDQLRDLGANSGMLETLLVHFDAAFSAPRKTAMRVADFLQVGMPPPPTAAPKVLAKADKTRLETIRNALRHHEPRWLAAIRELERATPQKRPAQLRTQ
mmetsp:Transcript_23618/g.79736  ORF Transcript_23618/g.79736 Transcript_23618/m.79736 type:complete len:162 (-) Transcript_23618:14-499(-)